MARQQAERLQKVLARAGIASRRAAEEMIVAGRVRVDGRVVSELGSKVNPLTSKIEVDGKRIAMESPVYFVFHKPRAVMSTLSDPEGRACIADYTKNIPERVYPVGRLDYHTSGVLVLTNDGALADALMHPRQGAPKVYVAKIAGTIGVEELGRLTGGMKLSDGERTAPCKAIVLREEARSTWLQLTLREGKNRQVHRMLEGIGKRVMRLARTSYAGLTAEDLRPGQMRPLNRRDLDKLKKRYMPSQ